MHSLETAKEVSSMPIYLRVRPPRAMDGDVDEETGLRTFEIIREQDCGRRDSLRKGGCGRVSLGGGEEDGVLECAPARSVLSIPPSRSPQGSMTEPIGEKKEGSLREFVYTEVFPPEASQEYVYEASTRPLIDGMFLGNDGLLFVYGLTNAGKSFTTFGTKPNPGILPRVLTDIFERIEDIDSVCYESDVVISLFEIEDENIVDLLDLSGKSKDDRKAVELKDESGGVMWPLNMTRNVISTAEEGLELLKAAKANRQGVSTKFSQRSCLNHGICAINFCPLGFKDTLRKQGSVLWVVDLAGHENCKRLGTKNVLGSTEMKISSSDKSLNTLWQCLNMIHCKKSCSSGEDCSNSNSSLIPFQESKLTHIFEGHLSSTNAGSNTVMVVNINPSVPHFDDTYQVLSNSAITQRTRPANDIKPVRQQLGFRDINRRYKEHYLRRKSRVSIQREKAGMELSEVTPLKADAAYGLMALNCLNLGVSHRETLKYDDDQGGNVSGAESDGALEDRRHSLALVMEDLEGRNERLRKRLTAVKTQAARDIEKLKDDYEDRLVEQRRALTHRVKELEAEFDDFLEENHLDPADETVTTCSSFSSTDEPTTSSREYELQAEVSRLRAELASIHNNNFTGLSVRVESGRKSSRSSFKGGQHPLSDLGVKTISPSSDFPGDSQVEHEIGEVPTASERLGVSVPHLKEDSSEKSEQLQNHQSPQNIPVNFHEKMATPEKIANRNLEQSERRGFWRAFYCFSGKPKTSSRKPPVQPTNISPV
eukprot:74188_1